MRTIVIAASVLASLTAPAFAQPRHHVTSRTAAEFNALAPTTRAPIIPLQRSDATSPVLDKAPYCVWGALGDC